MVTREMSNKVAIAKIEGANYPLEPPFHPALEHPEYPFKQAGLSAQNTAYELVRNVLLNLGLDSANIGADTWNPLGEMVSPGMTVLIKPNLVLDRHPRGGALDCLITHGSIVRAIMDYIHIALEGQGKIIVGDSPIQGTDFEEATKANGLRDVVRAYRELTKLEVELVDFRQVIAVMDDRCHVVEWREADGDPAGYVEFDLGHDSMLMPIAKDSQKFRVSNYKASDTSQYHNETSHKYIVSKSVVDADVIVNIPKMKTHCKAGVTLGLKNFVGTVGRKQCLAHHRRGGTLQGGDEYPQTSILKSISETLERMIDGNSSNLRRSLYGFVYRVNERLIKMLGINQWREGCWHGNDTVWRMVVDLVRIARYGRPDGILSTDPQRKIFTLIDGVIGGENEGPLEATPKPSQCVIAGLDIVATEIVGAYFMGLDYQKIPLIRHTIGQDAWPLLDSEVRDIVVAFDDREDVMDEFARSSDKSPFVPAAGWVGHIELEG